MESRTRVPFVHLRLVAPGAAIRWGTVQDDHIDDHLAHLRRRNLSSGTIDQRRRTLARFARHAGVPLLDASTDQILDFTDRRTREGLHLQPESVAAELAHLAGFYKWAVIEDLRVDDPMVKVPRPKLARRLPHPIPEHDLARAIEEAPERVRPMLMLAAYAGLRACEIAPLKADDLWWHLDPPMIFIRRSKGGDEAAVPMAPILEPHLRDLPRRGWLFPKRDETLGPVKAHTVSHLCNDHLHRVGVWHHTLHSDRKSVV